MIIQNGKCYDRFEFLLIFANFAKQCGWSINKQSRTELYLKNKKENYLQIFMDYAAGHPQNHFCLFAGATGFNEESAFEEQPGYSRTNQHLAYKSSADVTAAWIFNPLSRTSSDMEGYILIGDEDTLFGNIFLRANSTFSFFSSNLTKNHNFNGGHIIFSDAFAGIGPYGNYGRSARGGYCTIEEDSSPFQLPPERANSFFSILIGGFWHVNHSYSQNSSIYNLITKSRIMTNLQDWSHFFYSMRGRSQTDPYYQNNKDYIKLSAASVYEIAKVLKDNNTGLNIMIAPEFFYKNDVEKWTHAGVLEKIRVIGFLGLNNKQELYLGSEKFMVFEPHGDWYNADKQVGLNRNRFGLAVKL